MSYKRAHEQKRRLKKSYNQAYPSYYGGIYFDSGKNRYVKIENSKDSKRRRVAKKVSNKKVRKNNTVLLYSHYKKLYDLWWNLY